MYDDKGQGAVDREEHARSHPIRARILALHKQGEPRSLSLEELHRELSAEKATVSVIAYHRRVLSDTGLLPRADD